MKLKNILEGCLFADGDWIESKDQDPTGEIRLIQLADIGDGMFIDKSKRFINKETAVRLRCTYLSEGDILIARMPDPLGRACVFPLSGSNKYVTAVDVCIIRVNNRTCYNRYLQYMLNTRDIRNVIQSQKTGTTRERITRKKLGELEIPLPPLPIQQKTAAILDAADELRQKDKALVAKYDELTKALFLDMFGDPLKNSLNFPFPKMKEICTVSQGMQIAISKRFKEGGLNRYKYITVAYINGRKKEEFIDNPRKSVVCELDEVLMTRTGNTGQVVTGVEGVFHNNFFKIDWDRTKLNKEYLVAFLSNPAIRAELLKRASTTTIPDLSHGQFYDVNIILPPLILQKQFAERIKTIAEQKNIAQASALKSEELFNSLLQKAFNGELV